MEASSLPPHVRLRKLLGRIRRRFAVDVFDVFVRPVPGDASFASPDGYEFAWGTAGDLARCDPFHTELDERERAEGQRRLGFGHLLVIAFHRGVPVFTMWANPRNLNVPGLMKRRLEPHQWFIYKAFTSPEHRGRKLYENGMRFVLTEMRRRGLAELVGYAHVDKGVSRKGLAALAFESVGRVTRVDFPLLCFTRLSPELAARFPHAVPRSGAMTREETSPRPA